MLNTKGNYLFKNQEYFIPVYLFAKLFLFYFSNEPSNFPHFMCWWTPQNLFKKKQETPFNCFQLLSRFD